jgi:hypothetical protein
VAIANPIELSGIITFVTGQSFSPVDIEGEFARAREALRETKSIDALVSRGDDTGRASLNNIRQKVSQGYDILYLVCHGALLAENPDDPDSPQSPYIVLELPDGRMDLVPGDTLVQQIRNLAAPQRPLLIVLASCQSAGQGQVVEPGEIKTSDEGALAALGPKLATAGVPSVVAMQDNITMRTVEQFMPVFFQELARDGQLERAMALARSAVYPTCSDWWVPVLFSRLRDGLLFRKDDALSGSASPPGRTVIAPGERSVAIGGSADHTIIITGDQGKSKDK